MVCSAGWYATHKCSPAWYMYAFYITMYMTLYENVNVWRRKCVCGNAWWCCVRMYRPWACMYSITRHTYTATQSPPYLWICISLVLLSRFFFFHSLSFFPPASLLTWNLSTLLVWAKTKQTETKTMKRDENATRQECDEARMKRTWVDRHQHETKQKRSNNANQN